MSYVLLDALVRLSALLVFTGRFSVRDFLSTYVQDARANNCSCVICISCPSPAGAIAEEQKPVMYRMYGMPVLQEQKPVTKKSWLIEVPCNQGQMPNKHSTGRSG